MRAGILLKHCVECRIRACVRANTCAGAMGATPSSVRYQARPPALLRARRRLRTPARPASPPLGAATSPRTSILPALSSRASASAAPASCSATAPIWTASARPPAADAGAQVAHHSFLISRIMWGRRSGLQLRKVRNTSRVIGCSLSYTSFSRCVDASLIC